MPNNWYFVSKIVLTYCKKKCSSDREKIYKTFEIITLEKFIQKVKGQNMFW